MSRLRRVQGVILRKYRIGDIHKGLVVLTDSLGLLHAIAHGAYKGRSRLAGSSEPLTHARFDLYHEPVKDSYKVTDITVLDSYDSIKAAAGAFSLASYWCECFIVSHAAGQSDASPYALLVGALDALSACPVGREVYADLQFAWRLLALLGHRPEAGVCPSCGRRVDARERMYVRRGYRSFSCDRCTPSARDGGALTIEPGALRYLERSQGLGFRQAAGVSLERSGAAALQAALHELTESVLESKLKALRVGAALA